uniref:LIM zinc-binding domain-containing protein n=1 Tax=Pygocentrus nattereri TaxID=42514 RepID=A0A3B4E202_PYGNA
MNPHCARCGKIVYATEKVNCLDKYWHKACFHCEVCKMTLNMNNYKGYEKKPYCNSHYPKQTFTIVADTPENLRLRQQSELQSQVKYRKNFEESKGRGLRYLVDTPEVQRLKEAQDQISNVKYHKDFEVPGLHGVTQGMRGAYLVRAQGRPNHQTMGSGAAQQDVHQYIMEMDRRPGVIVAPVLPGAYYPSGHSQGHSYMHQTSMHSLRSMQLRSHPATMVSSCPTDHFLFVFIYFNLHVFSPIIHLQLYSVIKSNQIYLCSAFYNGCCHKAASKNSRKDKVLTRM